MAITAKIKEDTGLVVAVMVDDNFTDDDVENHICMGMDVAEIRIDLFQKTDIPYVTQQVKKFMKLPTLATIRISDEGGNWQGTNAQRLALFKSIIPLVNAIDVEISELDILKELRIFTSKHQCDLVASYHNYNETPSDDKFLELVDDAIFLGADILKIACIVNSDKDNARLAALFDKKHNIPLIVIAMGQMGMHSRLSFPALGSVLTYSPSAKINVAPGQINFSKMVEILGFLYPEYGAKTVTKL